MPCASVSCASPVSDASPVSGAMSFGPPIFQGRVRTGPGKPGKSWNLIIWIPGLESHGILVQVMESHGI